MTSLLTASLMLTAAGLTVWLLFQRVPLNSWRLRSWLIASVLFQGVMLARFPVHLGWIEMREHAALVEPVDDLMGGEPFGGRRLGQTGPASPPAFGAGRVEAGNWSLSVLFEQVRGWNWRRAFEAIWITGVVLIVTHSLWRYLRLLRFVGRLDPAPKAWRSTLDQLWRSLEVGRRRPSCELLVSKTVGPLLVRRPRNYALIIPREYWASLTPKQQRSVIQHELAHIERDDVWRQLIIGCITSLHWFNPVAWWARSQYELACECACDQRVAQDGEQSAAGFATAIVQLVQWHVDHPPSLEHRRVIGCQAMASPPLTLRVARLVQSKPVGDPFMKRILVSLLAVAIALVSFFQFRLTSVQAQSDPGSTETLRVLDEKTAAQLKDVAAKLDADDSATRLFATLLTTPQGRLAVAGYLNDLDATARQQARDLAIPKFVEQHFARQGDGRLILKTESTETRQRWVEQSEQLSRQIAKLTTATADIASKLDDSSEAGGLFKRLLLDPQAPAAILMGEMKGGDVINRYLSEAMERILVDAGNGVFQIIESRRGETAKQIARFELAGKISVRLKEELPRLADEYAVDDEEHRELVRYLKHPVTAVVTAIQISEESRGSVAQAVDRLHQHFEGVSVDTASGLKIEDPKAWERIREIFGRVDRVEAILPRARTRLAEVAETLSMDDPLTQRLAVQMKQEALAAVLAADLPYAETDPGEELRAMLSQVLTESNGRYAVRSDVEQKVSEKATELLQTCRRIRRYLSDVDEFLSQLEDQSFVSEMGDAGRYMMLDQIRQHAEAYRPDPVALMKEDLFDLSQGDAWKVRVDRRERIRGLVEQSEAVRDGAAIDDF